MNYIAGLICVAALFYADHLHSSEYGQNDDDVPEEVSNYGGTTSEANRRESGSTSAARGRGRGGAATNRCTSLTNMTTQADCVWNSGRVDGWFEQTQAAVESLVTSGVAEPAKGSPPVNKPPVTPNLPEVP